MPYSTLWPRSANCMPKVPDPCGISNKSIRWKLRLTLESLEIIQGFSSMKFTANKTLSLNMSFEIHSLDTIKTVKLDVRQNLQRQAAGRMVYGCGIPGYHMCVVYPQSISVISSFHTRTHTHNQLVEPGHAKKKQHALHAWSDGPRRSVFFSWLVPPVGVYSIPFICMHNLIDLLFFCTSSSGVR